MSSYNLTDVKLTDEILTELENAIIKTYEQGERSISDEGDCKYRDADGNKCLVGHGIRDDEYHPNMDNEVASTFNLCDPEIDTNIRRFVKYRQDVPEFPSILFYLQACHDDAYGEFRRDFVKLLEDKYDEGKLPRQLRKVITSLQRDLEDQ